MQQAIYKEQRFLVLTPRKYQNRRWETGVAHSVSAFALGLPFPWSCPHRRPISLEYRPVSIFQPLTRLSCHEDFCQVGTLHPKAHFEVIDAACLGQFATPDEGHPFHQHSPPMKLANYMLCTNPYYSLSL